MAAWGALAFGAVYPWAYRPLLAAAAILGLTGWLTGRSAPGERALVLALTATAAAVALQLVPWPPAALAAISPQTDALLRQYDVAYAAAPGPHPLSIAPASTMTGLVFLAALSVLLVGTARALTATGARALVSGLVLLGAAVALAGIISGTAPGGRIYGVWQPEHHVMAQPFGPFVNRNHFAGWMAMALPAGMGLMGALAAGWRHGCRGGWRRLVERAGSREGSVIVLVAFALLVMGLALSLTMSRSGMVSFAAAVGVMGALALVRSRKTSTRLLAAASLALLLAGSIAWAGAEAVAGRLATQGGLDGRLAIWRDAARVVRDFPLAGTGLNTFGAAMLFYQSGRGSHYQEAHNEYVQLAAEGGLLVGVPAAAALAVFVALVRRRLREETDERVYWLRAGAVTGLLAIALQSLVEFSLQMPGNAVLFALLAAVALHGRPTLRRRSVRLQPDP